MRLFQRQTGDFIRAGFEQVDSCVANFLAAREMLADLNQLFGLLQTSQAKLNDAFRFMLGREFVQLAVTGRF